MECITNLSKNPDVQKVINTYCWVSSLFTYDRKKTETEFSKQNFHQPRIEAYEPKVIIHSYYRWVPFMLFFQAITFYVPHWIWKMWEGGKIRMITKNVREFHMDIANKKHSKQNKLVCISNNMHTYRILLLIFKMS